MFSLVTVDSYSETESQKQFELLLKASANTMIGSDFKVVAVIKNKTKSVHRYHVTLNGWAIHYIGTSGQIAMKSAHIVKINPGESEYIIISNRNVKMSTLLFGIERTSLVLRCIAIPTKCCSSDSSIIIMKPNSITKSA